MRLIVAVAATALLLPACGGDDPSVDTTATTGTSDTTTTSEWPGHPDAELNHNSRIGADGIHPLKAGMSLAEVRETAGREVILEGFDDFGGYCWFARIEGLEEDFSLLFLAPDRTEAVGDPDQGELGRASTHGDLDTSPARSTGGPGVGSTKDEVMETYNRGPGHSIEVTPHVYADGGEYIDIGSAKHDDGLLLRFETDGRGVVTAIHGGLEDAVKLIEGCA